MQKRKHQKLMMMMMMMLIITIIRAYTNGVAKQSRERELRRVVGQTCMRISLSNVFHLGETTVEKSFRAESLMTSKS